MLIFDILHDTFRSLSQKVDLSYLEVFGCDSAVLRNNTYFNYSLTRPPCIRERETRRQCVVLVVNVIV
jgi:hypothetical protein